LNAKVFLFLILATTLETLGDAIVRIGIGQTAWLPRNGLFAVGVLLLFGYGVSLNLAPIEFNRVVGLYIATLFIVWQIVNFVVFGTTPPPPVLLGGLLIVVGGLVVTFWVGAVNDTFQITASAADHWHRIMRPLPSPDDAGTLVNAGLIWLFTLT
jgi:small multidrug resistance family-3 protein